MSVNIQALLNLFPASPVAVTDDDTVSVGTIRGACGYADGWGFPTPFVAVIDAVRADQFWGPVYRGELSAYAGDQSRADLALCGEFARRGLDGWYIDIALRTSGLYRKKWERNDYRKATIAKALANVKGKAAGERPTNPLDLQNGKIKIDTSNPAPRDYTLDGLLLPGKSGVLAGFGGVSKTQFALQLSIALVLGTRFMGKAVKSGSVIAILGEEDKAEIERRLNAVVRHSKLGDAEIKRIEAGLVAFPLVGQDMRLTAVGEKGLTEQGFAQKIIDAAKAKGDVRLIALDHLALIHGGDFNAREDAALTMRIVNHIAQETQASVLVLAHTPKSANDREASDATMVAGSTAFVDQARGAWVLAGMRTNEAKDLGISDGDRPGYVSLAIAKNNYGPTGDVIWFKRTPFDGVGLLEHVMLSVAATTAKAVANLEATLIAFVASNRGQYSKTRLRDTKSGKKGQFKASKGDLEGAIEALLKNGRLINRPPTDQERAAFDHSPRVKHVLDVGP